MTQDQIKHMVEQFLRWRLPETFHPDGGITFEPVGSKGTQYEFQREPVGTNLLTYKEALEMVLHMLDGLPAAPALDASQTPDPVVKPDRCQPTVVENDTLESLFAGIRNMMTRAEYQHARFGYIAATIRVNALRHGATNEEVEAMVRGEKDFVQFIASKVEENARPISVTEAAKVLLADIAMALDSTNPKACEATKRWVEALDAAEAAPTAMARPTLMQMIRAALRQIGGSHED